MQNLVSEHNGKCPKKRHLDEGRKIECPRCAQRHMLKLFFERVDKVKGSPPVFIMSLKDVQAFCHAFELQVPMEDEGE